MAKSDEGTEKRVRTLGERRAPKGHGTPFYVLAFITAVLVLNAVFGNRGLLAMLRARSEYSEMATELARVQQANAALREQARKLRSDPATIEEIARTELGLIRPGETVFIIKDLPSAAKK